MKKILLPVLFLLILTAPLSSHAITLQLNYPDFGGPPLGDSPTFQEFVAWLFRGLIVISTAAAFGVVIWGGIEYLTSAGNPSKMQSGIDRIQNAIIGILIIILAYLVLETIDPHLITLPSLDLPS